MSTKSLWNEITNRAAAGVPDSTDLVLFAPQPGVAFTSQAQHCTVAALVASGLAFPLGEILFGSGTGVSSSPQLSYVVGTGPQSGQNQFNLGPGTDSSLNIRGMNVEVTGIDPTLYVQTSMGDIEIIVPIGNGVTVEGNFRVNNGNYHSNDNSPGGTSNVNTGITPNLVFKNGLFISAS